MEYNKDTVEATEEQQESYDEQKLQGVLKSEMDDAQNFFDNRGLDNSHSIEVRKGAATRCDQNWCRVQEFCDQYLNKEIA